ncbi:AraC family transcriptional regulator [Croceicoccus sp. Ery15]|uniref:helix-turn-helix domain-containing protein n=1 Tax=Croceicoccus sp. Ery15 TaxID=1703338 RepID=UPI001E2991DB|nr:AraC family transcriptional regulator [Croceicoccus sp. Ery15]
MVTSTWARASIDSIEHLQDAVLGAGLEAIQLSRGRMRGSLAFASHDDITYSSGRIDGDVVLSGALSETMVTLGVGVVLAPGSRHWFREVESGGIGVFLGGDAHHAVYTPGSVYACATLPADRLEGIAAEMGLVMDNSQLGATGISPRSIPLDCLNSMQHDFALLHSGRADASGAEGFNGRGMLEAIIDMLAREPRAIPPASLHVGYGRLVARALDYIIANLDEPLSIAAIAREAGASHRTLYRAFHYVLDETPQSYIRKLRLNRIRYEIANDAEALCTITIIANRWGISELGRFSGWYRQLFGELPSQTRASLSAAAPRMEAEGSLALSA